MEIDWERIESFVGFGRRDAPVVFIGMEEGLTEEESLENDLVHRSQFAPVMDLEMASRGIAGTRKWFDLAIVRCQRTWRPMCDLMLRREGVRAPTKDERNTYQARRLGRSDGDRLSAELLPYPNTRSSRWSEIYKQRFPNRHQYRSQMSKMRIALLRQVLSETDRPLVVCYGKATKTSIIGDNTNSYSVEEIGRGIVRFASPSLA
jgi:hypothetical protein